MNEQRQPLPGYYFAERDGEPACGPHVTAEEATAHVLWLIEKYELNPSAFTFFRISEVTVLPESLPRGGE